MSKIRIAALFTVGALAGSAHSANPRDPDYYWDKNRPAAVVEAKAQSARADGPMHRVFKCHPVDRIWHEKMVLNDSDGSTSNYVEPYYHTMCPMGSGVIAFEAAAARESKPYDDTSNPLNPNHKFH